MHIRSMLLDPVKMRMEYFTKCSIFLNVILKFCERNSLCGSSRDRRVM